MFTADKRFSDIYFSICFYYQSDVILSSVMSNKSQFVVNQDLYFTIFVVDRCQNHSQLYKFCSSLMAFVFAFVTRTFLNDFPRILSMLL